MPEVIEVKGYSDFIDKHVCGKKLTAIKILKGRYKTHGPFSFYKKIKNKLPLKILEIGSKGKFMYMALDQNFYIGVTLGLKGGWFYKKLQSKKMIHGLDTERFDIEKVENYLKNALNNINIEFVFKEGSLYFYDQLSFGTIKIFLSREDLDKKLESIGIDMMNLETTFSMFKEQIMKENNHDKYIGNVLMNQKLISGIGNYLRADVLWLTKISPFRKVKKISDEELLALFNSIRKLIWSSYDYDEALRLKIIKRSDILPAKYERDFLVYMHETDIYNNQVTKEKLYEGSQIRYIYWVKKIQK